MSYWRLTPIFAIAFASASMTSAYADPAADEAAIMQRFQRWTADFNAKDSAGVCDLFAPKKRHDQGRQTNSFVGSTPPSALRNFQARGRGACPNPRQLIEVHFGPVKHWWSQPIPKANGQGDS
jgi:hypothetical protein